MGQAPTADPQRWQSAGAEPAKDMRTVMKRCREWLTDNPYLAALVGLKVAFLNYRMRLVARDKADAKALKDWRNDSPKEAAAFHQAVRLVWLDLEVMDNAVVFWREEGAVIVVPPEVCRYSNAMGEERLFINPGWTKEDLKALPVDQQKRFSQEFEVKDSEAFRVITSHRPGFGFAIPRLRGLFRSLEAFQSMEVGDQLQAFLLRRVLVQWKIGHEIRTGAHAGKPTHFFKQVVANAIRRKTEGMFGVVEMVTNFDASPSFPAPDPKVFDESRYRGVIRRIHQWAGPLGAMLEDPQAANAAWTMFRAEAITRRDEMSSHIAELAQIMGCPVAVRPIWGNQCFQDQRVAAEMLRHALESGPLSQRTYLEEAGFDQDEEQGLKAEEAVLAGSADGVGQVTPIYSRGTGQRQVGAGGRPAGVGDSGARA